MFDSRQGDDYLGSAALTRLLVSKLDLHVITAGGIMDGAGIVASLDLGAEAAQLGTGVYRLPRIVGRQILQRGITIRRRLSYGYEPNAISGRTARCLANLSAGQIGLETSPSLFLIILLHIMTESVNEVAKSRSGRGGYGAHWAGQGAPLARTLPAAELMAQLQLEMAQIMSQKQA